MAKQSHHIISKFGETHAEGITTLAKALEHKFRTKVQGWYDRGWIPPRHYKAIIRAAEDRDIELTADDFLDFDECA